MSSATDTLSARAGTTWQLDPSGSKAEFRVKHPGQAVLTRARGPPIDSERGVGSRLRGSSGRTTLRTDGPFAVVRPTLRIEL
jgi:hypothetical protein